MKKYNIVFSIPVHEKTEVVIDQIININHYNENCAIVLHISKAFDFVNSNVSEKRFVEIVNSFGNVYINDIRLKTIYCNIVHVHVINFEYIERLAEFDYFILLASNEEFIRTGLYNEIKEYICGFNYQKLYDVPNWSHQKKALEDPVVSKICSRFDENISNAVKSQVEGCFFKKNLFHEIAQLIKELYPISEAPPLCLYPREEVYYQEIAYFLIQDKTKILKTYITHNARDNVTWTPYTWVIRRVASSMSTEYSVKRVGRELNHPTRSFIRNQCGHYSQEVREILPDTRDVPIIRIYLYDFGMVLKDILIKTMRWIKHMTKFLRCKSRETD